MGKARVLFVSQEITPFLPETTISSVSRQLPQGIHDRGKEIRVFMPRFGKINERRHQLHEVIRLSGMNMIINDSDHPLIIKVASIPTARMQVYFIDNEEYFHRKAVFHDDNEQFFKDNDERSIFFVKGVLETVKKLGWAPDIIHCHGWMTSLLPVYVRELYKEDPHFAETKLVYSAYDQPFQELDNDLARKISLDGIDRGLLETITTPDLEGMHKLAIQHADAVIEGTAGMSSGLTSFAESLNKPVLSHTDPDSLVNNIDQFYDEVLLGKSVLVED
ncbi:MAG: glycogen/starch synthase [Flavobacteriales bacterium]|nr:glycogen/starch synthase [Flavobacteriales bacterium]